MRLFCAVEIPEELRAEIRRASAPLRATGAGVKWVKEDQLHLTLAFLGEVPDAAGASQSLAAAAKTVAPFEARIGPYGAFPDFDHPKVLWVGLSQGEEEMTALADALRSELSARRLPFDDKPFRAHATLGRVQRPGGMKAIKDPAYKLLKLPSFRIEEAVLFSSAVGHAGASYEAVSRARLGPR